MAIRPVIIAPDPRLKARCAPVEAVNSSVRALMDDLLDSMYAANGIGLAAPQIGIESRVIVVDTAKDAEPRRPLRLANPEIVWVSEDPFAYEEGCLSLPEHYAEVVRPAHVRVRYRDEDNVQRELEAKNVLATCLQHEMDHLDGVLFVDHISALKRNIILRKLTKTKRQQEVVAD